MRYETVAIETKVDEVAGAADAETLTVRQQFLQSRFVQDLESILGSRLMKMDDGFDPISDGWTKSESDSNNGDEDDSLAAAQPPDPEENDDYV